MVEMTETAAILHQAGPARWSWSMRSAEAPRRWTVWRLPGLFWRRAFGDPLPHVFATHFHELAELADRFPGITRTPCV